jgi:SulP family sulfate permease
MAEKPKLEHVVLMCTAVNAIDMSALQTQEKVNQTLSELGIKLHLSEVKGPIMDKLIKTNLFANLSGSNYLSHNQAVEDLRDQKSPLLGA